MNYKYVIIGADAAGNSAAGQIRRNDKEGSLAILEKGDIVSYGACGLPYTLSGEIPETEKLIHFTAESFGKKVHADVLTRHEVVSVDFTTQTLSVKTPNGNRDIGYEKLLVATGASPIRLPFIDYSNERVFELKTVPDANRLLSFIETHQPRNAAILGAGYIGLEVAENLRMRGIEVTIFEAMERPMPRLSAEFGEEISRQLAAHGVTLHTNTPIESVRFENNSVQITAKGQAYGFDFLVSAPGVRPATSFLNPDSIAMQRGAIFVNAYGETSVPNVYAAGDCATVPHHLTKEPVWIPLGHTANKTGRIAGMNMSGSRVSFPGVLGTQLFKLFDKMIASTGLTAEEAEKAGFEIMKTNLVRPSKAGYYPSSGKVYLSMVASTRSREILGVAMHGPLDSYGLIDAAAALISQKATVDEVGWLDMAYAPPFAPVWNALVSAAAKFSGGD